MSAFTVPIDIANLESKSWVRLDALVDTGSSICSVPASILRSLNVEPTERHEFEFAQGEVRGMDVAEVRIRFANCDITTPVMFNEEDTEPLLGVMALERAFLGVDPHRQRLVPVAGLGRSGRNWRRT